jgi:outer membrane protein
MLFSVVVVGALFAGCQPKASAQMADAPSAARMKSVLQAQMQVSIAPTNSAQANAAAKENLPETSTSVSIPAQLTLQQAEQIALHNNPRIHVAQLLARAEHQVTRETRSQYLPQLEGDMTAVQANEASRMTLDDLRSTRLLTHAGGGVTLDQKIFDFGRTPNLIAAAKLREKAQNANALASQMDILLITNQAFYNALEAQALVKLAQQTVDTRTTTNNQIVELTKNKLRSDLDLAVSQENVAQANLLLLDAQTRYETELNALTAVLGFDHAAHYELVEDTAAPPLPPPDPDVLVEQALRDRPDLLALNDDQLAAKKFSRAQREQMLPSIAATGTAGGTPARSETYFNTDWFGAVGVTMKVPIFNGFLYSAQAAEADRRAQAAQENLRDLRTGVVRDVRNAWLQANTSYKKISATEKFLNAANLGLNLAESRYKLGLSSIVELSQAQLTQTQASIENVNARLDYELSLAALNYQIGNLR